MGLEILFFTQICVGALMMIFLHRLNKLNKQIDYITQEVKNYLAIITQEEEEVSRKIPKRDEERESRLIQSVLREYFP